MKKEKLIIKIIFLVVLFLVGEGVGQAQQNITLKLALLETPYNEMPLNFSLLTEYEKAYFAGIEAAVREAKKYHIEIKYKTFFYGNGSLDVLDEIVKIRKWNADLIVGPSHSDQFTLIKNTMTKVMVVSPNASGKTLQSLPNNFYSISLPDSEIISLLSNHIHQKFPGKNIYIIVQTDCKQCVDVSKLFTSSFKNLPHQTRSIVVNKLFLDNINAIDAKKLMMNHYNDVTLIFNLTFYDYTKLVKHIAQTLPDKHLIFYSELNNWHGKTALEGPTKNYLPYQIYRIGPIFNNSNLPEFNNFTKDYYEIYQTEPKYDISYMTYLTVMSAVKALDKYQSYSPAVRMSDKVLYSYLTALKNNPNWYRINKYAIYKSTPKREVLVEKLHYQKKNL